MYTFLFVNLNVYIVILYLLQIKNNMVERYIECVKKEIIQYATENKTMWEHGLEPKFIVKTIYLGGGTPSYIDEDYIVQIMETIKHNFEGKRRRRNYN